MKKTVLIIGLLVIAMIVMFASFQPFGSIVHAQGGLTYTSGINVQNLGPTTATVSLDFFPQSGADTVVNDTIAANSVKKYFPLPGVSVGFNGSLVISSDQPLYAIVNVAANSFAYLASYESFSQGATSVNLPLIARNNAGYFTWFNVQNAGSVQTTVQVTYFPKPGIGNPGTETLIVDPGRSVTFDQSANGTIGRISDGRFVGSAVVTSTGSVPIVAAVQYLNNGSNPSFNTPTLGSYRAFLGSEGSTTQVVPLVQSANANFYSGIQVQNTGNTTTTATVTYSPPSCGGCTFNPVPEFKDIGPNQSVNFLQTVPNGQWTGLRYVGSASIASNNGQKLVTLVSQFKPVSPAQNSIYEGFDPATATAKVIAPTIQSANGGYFSGISVRNLAGVTTTVSVQYTANSCGGCLFSPVIENKNVGPNSNGVFNQTAGTGQWIGDPAHRYVGGAIITSSGAAPIVATVNQFAPAASGDTLSTYDALNVAP